jgi:hypothetical protein
VVALVWKRVINIGRRFGMGRKYIETTFVTYEDRNLRNIMFLSDPELRTITHSTYLRG